VVVCKIEIELIRIGFLYGIITGKTIEESIRYGLRAAQLTLQSQYSVYPGLNTEVIKQ
jgi:sugar/nucleoside kinase (ribokinase family)